MKSIIKVFLRFLLWLSLTVVQLCIALDLLAQGNDVLIGWVLGFSSIVSTVKLIHVLNEIYTEWY